MIILAFDGIVADTLPMRATALRGAIDHVGQDPPLDVSLDSVVSALLPGRSFYEVARELQREIRRAASTAAAIIDETWCDLVAVAAQQRVSMAFAQGASLTNDFRAWREAPESSRHDWILRADSTRRDVERWLSLTDLEPHFRMIRCADDLPRETTRSSLENSYHAIAHRGISNRSRGYAAMNHDASHPGVAQPLIAVEAGDDARRVAGQYLSDVSPDRNATPVVVLSSLPRTR